MFIFMVIIYFFLKIFIYVTKTPNDVSISDRISKRKIKRKKEERERREVKRRETLR